MYFKHRNKFRLTRFIIFQISPILRFLSKFRKPAKRILIVKIDAIGDYVLFRNYLEVVYKSDKFKGYEIELLGNISWKELAIEYDKQFVSKFIFIHEDSLYQKPGKVFKLGLKLFKRKYELVLQSTYSRTLMGNGLSALASGRETIAYNSDNEHHPAYKRQTDKFYSKLLMLPKSIIHEFERNHFFFKSVIEDPQLNLPLLSLPYSAHHKANILIFPGSSDHKRNWEKEKFVNIITRLLVETNENIIVGGGSNEIAIASAILGQLPSTNRVIDRSGHTNLVDFVELVAGSKLVITNETSTAHIAAACRIPVVAIVGGGHIERFLPYPQTILFKPISIFAPMECFKCNWLCRYPSLEHDPFPCISRVNVDIVWKKVKEVLSDT